MMNKRGGDFDGGHQGGGKRARGFGNKIGMRVIVPSKMAGCLIGKGGQNIQALRAEFNCNIRIPDCAGPERILEITGENWESVYDCLQACVPWLYECPNGQDDDESKELRFLVNQGVIGGIIGRGGEKIRSIRTSSGANVKVYSNPCPQSTDRCVQANGTLEKLLAAAREIYEIVANDDSQNLEELYNPINFDAFFANDYGGFGGGAASHKMGGMPGRGRGGMPPRGGPMGRGGPMMGGMRGDMMGGPGFGMGFDEMDMGMGRGGFRGARGGGGFGRGGFGMAFSDNEWGGGFGAGGGHGGGGGPELKFLKCEDSSTQVTISNDMAGAIIGPGGQRIRKIRNDSKANVTIGEPDSKKDRIITIAGDPESIQTAQFFLQQAVRDHSGGNNGYGGY